MAKTGRKGEAAGAGVGARSARGGAPAAPVAPKPLTPAPATNGANGRKKNGGPLKSFVLDTNVLLHDGKALTVFQDNNVVVPFPVIEELDRFKREEGEIGRNARQAIRHLDELSKKGRLIEGVRWGGPDTGIIRVDIEDHVRPQPLNADSPDNRIIACAYSLHKRGERTVFISKDINARVKSRALEIPAEDFENRKIDADRLYTGQLEAVVTTELIDDLHEQRMLPLDRLKAELLAQAAAAREAAGEEPNGEDDEEALEIAPNEFVLMRDALDTSHTGLGRRLADTEHLIPISGPRKPVFGILPRNVQQTMALDLLLEDEINLVTLTGGAGTGKTLLALAAGMQKVFQEERYERLLIARPIMPMGRDIGYLPGDKDEKLAAWMQPIFDNLEFLMQTRGSHMQHAESKSAEQRLERLLADGKVVVEALTYIRGRSIPNQFLIVDEAQNLTPHEVKTVVTRVGEGTKIVLTGDIAQIDNPYLDKASNGLSYTVERMKGLGMVGHVTLLKSERSELASHAVERL